MTSATVITQIRNEKKEMEGKRKAKDMFEGCIAIRLRFAMLLSADLLPMIEEFVPLKLFEHIDLFRHNTDDFVDILIQTLTMKSG